MADWPARLAEDSDAAAAPAGAVRPKVASVMAEAAVNTAPRRAMACARRRGAPDARWVADRASLSEGCGEGSDMLSPVQMTVDPLALMKISFRAPSPMLSTLVSFTVV
jgi:hypothetical protein